MTYTVSLSPECHTNTRTYRRSALVPWSCCTFRTRLRDPIEVCPPVTPTSLSPRASRPQRSGALRSASRDSRPSVLLVGEWDPQTSSSSSCVSELCPRVASGTGRSREGGRRHCSGSRCTLRDLWLWTQCPRNRERGGGERENEHMSVSVLVNCSMLSGWRSLAIDNGYRDLIACSFYFIFAKSRHSWKLRLFGFYIICMYVVGGVVLQFWTKYK